ncbi:MAG TPA: mechanosensitive ion channel family protein [Candidatus Nanoarchaeia archaeon]|nr:mechanosensitive ion channel family protein [Candidatus Nanoarchaeia archaeon]
MVNFQEFFALSFGGNTVRSYIIALAVFFISIALIHLFKTVVIARLKVICQKTKTQWDDAVINFAEKIGWPFYFMVALYPPLKFLKLPAIADVWLNYGIMIVLIYYSFKGFNGIVDYGTHEVMKKRDQSDAYVIKFFSKLLKVLLWVIAGLLILSNLGYNINSLMAGLGIGGVAIALALQSVFADLFASVSIYFDKPFKVGDFIMIGETKGEVKKIGIKTTRLQSLWGEEIIISNQELTSSRIQNYKRMERRRIQFKFGVTYQTAQIKLKKIPEIVKEVFEKLKNADLDRVHFKEFGDFSLNFEVAYYVNSSEYNIYMDIQQQINLALKERFEKEGIDFAYPTQTVLLSK